VVEVEPVLLGHVLARLGGEQWMVAAEDVAR